MSTHLTCQEAASQLDVLMERLSPRQTTRALRNTLNQAARQVRKSAKSELVATDLHNASRMLNTIGCGVRRDFQGFYVRVPNHGDKYMHRNRWGLLKPIAFWWGVGASERQTKRKGGRGSIPAHDFLQRAKKATFPGIEANLAAKFADNVNKIAAKYGVL